MFYRGLKPAAPPENKQRQQQVQRQKQIPPLRNDSQKGNSNSNDNSFNAKGAKGATFREEEQATATTTATTNAGISPLRRKVRASGRDDEAWVVLESCRFLPLRLRSGAG
jgi:hypothetical protein